MWDVLGHIDGRHVLGAALVIILAYLLVGFLRAGKRSGEQWDEMAEREMQRRSGGAL